MQISPQAILSESANPDADSRLREFAHNLAKTHTVEISHPQKTDLLERLKGWEQALRNANAIFKAVPAKDLAVSRAGEWMLDNFYIIKQTFRQIEEDLPAGFLNQLPKLDETSLKGHSRIFALAWEWIGYSQGQIDLIQVAAFVQDYQQITPLKIGELWLGVSDHAAHRDFGTARVCCGRINRNGCAQRSERNSEPVRFLSTAK